MPRSQSAHRPAAPAGYDPSKRPPLPFHASKEIIPACRVFVPHPSTTRIIYNVQRELTHVLYRQHPSYGHLETDEYSIVMFVDGACKDQDGALKAGYGLYFGDNSSHNANGRAGGAGDQTRTLAVIVGCIEGLKKIKEMAGDTWELDHEAKEWPMPLYEEKDILISGEVYGNSSKVFRTIGRDFKRFGEFARAGTLLPRPRIDDHNNAFEVLTSIGQDTERLAAYARGFFAPLFHGTTRDLPTPPPEETEKICPTSAPLVIARDLRTPPPEDVSSSLQEAEFMIYHAKPDDEESEHNYGEFERDLPEDWTIEDTIFKRSSSLSYYPVGPEQDYANTFELFESFGSDFDRLEEFAKDAVMDPKADSDGEIEEIVREPFAIGEVYDDAQEPYQEPQGPNERVPVDDEDGLFEKVDIDWTPTHTHYKGVVYPNTYDMLISFSGNLRKLIKFARSNILQGRAPPVELNMDTSSDEDASSFNSTDSSDGDWENDIFLNPARRSSAPRIFPHIIQSCAHMDTDVHGPPRFGMDPGMFPSIDMVLRNPPPPRTLYPPVLTSSPRLAGPRELDFISTQRPNVTPVRNYDNCNDSNNNKLNTTPRLQNTNPHYYESEWAYRQAHALPQPQRSFTPPTMYQNIHFNRLNGTSSDENAMPYAEGDVDIDLKHQHHALYTNVVNSNSQPTSSAIPETEIIIKSYHNSPRHSLKAHASAEFFREGGNTTNRVLKIIIATSSSYVVKSITSNVFKWKKNGWKDEHDQPAEYADVIEELHKAVKGCEENGIAVEFWLIGKEEDEFEGDEVAGVGEAGQLAVRALNERVDCRKDRRRSGAYEIV